MTPREVSTRLPRTQAVADALARWMQMGAKKPKRTYRRKETPAVTTRSNAATTTPK